VSRRERKVWTRLRCGACGCDKVYIHALTHSGGRRGYLKLRATCTAKGCGVVTLIEPSAALVEVEGAEDSPGSLAAF
jgi:hypothetical protein